MVMRNSKTKFAVLGMLSFGPKSGYDISKATKNSTAFFWAESDGQLYPILKRLTDEGLISFVEYDKPGKRKKKVYDLTEEGLNVLIDWLHQNPTTFSVRNEFILQLFFGHNLKPKENLEKIELYQFQLQQQLKLFASIEERIKQDSQYPTYLLLSLSYGQHGLKAEINWCSEAITVLKKQE